MTAHDRAAPVQPPQLGAPDDSVGQIAATLLIEAGAVLATSLDPATTMAQVAGLTVPRLADICVIDMLDDRGVIADIAVAAADEQLAKELREMRQRRPVQLGGPHPVASVIATGQAKLLAEMDEPDLRAFAVDAEHASFMLASRYRSAVVAPLTARDRTFGAISLLRLEGRQPYRRADLGLACDLANRAALAIDNARLYSDLRSIERRLEAILVSLAEAVTVVDRHGRTIFANRAAMRLHGLALPSRVDDSAPRLPEAPLIAFDEQGRRLSAEEMPARRLLRGEQPEPLLIRTIVPGSREERWLIVRASAVADAGTGTGTGKIAYAVNVFEDVTEMKRAQITEQFLAEVTRVLSSSLDHTTTLRRIAGLLVPRLASMCAVSLLDERGEIVPAAIRHRDTRKLHLARELVKLYPPHGDDVAGVGAVIRSGRLLYAHPDDQALAAYAQDAHHLELLRQLRITDVIVVPLLGAGRTLGAVTVISETDDRPLTAGDLAMLEEIGRRAGVALENARLFTERSRIAGALQRALLPDALPQIRGTELAALYTPAGELNEVGGDFYDVCEHSDGRWVLAIGDVCGKGANAAAVTAVARHTLRAAAMSGQSPRMLAISVHKALASRPTGPDMCTLSLILVDLRPPGAHLTVVLAGHPHPLLVDADGHVTPIGLPGTLLGVLDPVRLEQTEVDMSPGDTVILYTDGVSDAGAPQHPLGEDGLRELCTMAPQLTLTELLDRIAESATEHAGGSARDDIALLALRCVA